MALARNQIQLPAELLITHPTYENWKTDSAGRSGRDYLDFHEPLYFGHHYRFGSLVGGNGGDVSGFSMITENSARGVDYFKIGHTLGKDLKAIETGKKLTRSNFDTSSAGNINIAQYRNLAVYVTDDGKADFYILCAPGAIQKQEKGIQFLQHEKTWIALTPIGMNWQGRDEKLSRGYAPAGDMLVGKGTGGAYAGFAMEVGEPETHGSFEQFVQQVLQKSQVSSTAENAWVYSGVKNNSVGLQHAGSLLGPFVNKQDQPWILERVRTAEEVYASYPKVLRNGKLHDWRDHFAQYANPENPGAGPVSLGFKKGQLRVTSNHWLFEGTMTPEGVFSFSNSQR